MRAKCPACRQVEGVERLSSRWYCAPCDLVFTGSQREWDEHRKAVQRRELHAARIAPIMQPAESARREITRAS